MKLTQSIKTLVTQIVARDVAAGVELARSLGYAMPGDFDVGVSFHDEYDGRTRIRMRLDDARYDALVHLPELDDRQSMQRSSQMWEVAWERIHADALTVAHVWIERHPEAHMRDVTKTLGFLDALESDDALSKKWMAECAERAKHFRYTPSPADLVKELDP